MMTEFQLGVQSDIDRLGGIVVKNFPRIKVQRYKDSLLVKKNFFSFLIFKFDEYGLNCRESPVLVGVAGIVTLLFRRSRWIEETGNKIIYQYEAGMDYPEERIQFARKYNSCPKLGLYSYRMMGGWMYIFFIFGVLILTSMIKKPNLDNGAGIITLSILFGLPLIFFILRARRYRIYDDMDFEPTIKYKN